MFYFSQIVPGIEIIRDKKRKVVLGFEYIMILKWQSSENVTLIRSKTVVHICDSPIASPKHRSLIRLLNKTKYKGTTSAGV